MLNNNLNSQNQNLFEEVSFGSEIYYNWIADWSIDKENDNSATTDYFVYQFNKNDTLYLIRNEKTAYKFPFKFYEYNDTTYLSLYDNGIKIISREHFDAMWTNLNIITLEQDSFSLYRGFSRRKNVFYKSTSNTIHKDKYLEYLVGKQFERIGIIKCGKNESSHQKLNFEFITDSTYILRTNKITTAPKEKRKEEIITIDTLSFNIIEDTLVLEAKNKHFNPSTLQIRQRIGRTQNKLIIGDLTESKN